MSESIINVITDLSREFGAPEYVLGGGGNTSCKDVDTLWVKPSGTVLSEMTPESFVALSRAKLGRLYTAEPPDDPDRREAMVKELAMASVLPDSSGRPSVEAPLHDSFAATFVVHTHPFRVNGMTCAKNGEKTCRELFPDALWIPYTDPGYTLCMRVREEMEAYSHARGRQPDILFLQNHGIFVAGNTAEAVRQTYDKIFRILDEAYDQAGVDVVLEQGEEPGQQDVRKIHELVADVFGADGAFVTGSGPLSLVSGPLSPDHIVYSKARVFTGEPTAGALRDFYEQNGYWPRVICSGTGVFGVGASEKQARLALGFAMDAARVQLLSRAFGGVRFMEQRASDFIENWEVESYRGKVAG